MFTSLAIENGLADTDCWQMRASALAKAPRAFHSAVWSGTELIVWGGFDGTRSLRDGLRYNPSTDSWMPISTTGAPVARAFHTAIWTGTEMIVWGGADYITRIPVNSGARYNPVSDTWLPLPTSGAPTPRLSHTAVWTGSEMIIWGGSLAGGAYAGDGARFDPLNNRWLATGTASAPGARSSHTAVWTGSEMIVWGGSGSAGALRDGALYSPSTDIWVATLVNSPINYYGGASGIGVSPIGSEDYVGIIVQPPGGGGGGYPPAPSAPAARTMHSAVWSGYEMIVWGGTDGYGNAYGDGSRYNPANDSWKPITAGGGPSGRWSHTAVWTGAEMIVWGGTNGILPGTGGRYNPTLELWSSMAATAAPSGRANPSAVWTGGELIITHGYRAGSGSGFLSDAYVYGPAAPRLTAAMSGSGAMLSWDHQTGFVLESTTSLVPPVVWSPVYNGTAFGVPVTPSDAQRYYRLKR